MPEQEIMSPPWPGEGSTTDLLYARLLELRDWISRYRDELNESAGQDIIPVLRKPPAKAVYAMQPVLLQFQHFSYMRQIRAAWDALVRDWEEEWDSNGCLRQRSLVIRNAAEIFNDAFTPFEVREAQSVRQQERMQRRFERLRRRMDQIVGTDEDEDEDEDGSDDITDMGDLG